MNFAYFEVLKYSAPELIVTVGALLILFLDLIGIREQKESYRAAFLACTTAIVCAIGIVWLQAVQLEGTVLGGMVSMNPVTTLVKQCILGLTALTALVSWRTQFTHHLGEYFTLLLLATVGMMFLAGADHLLMIFVSLELTSLSLYILVAFNKQSRLGAEASLKYFLFGGMAAAFTLYGVSLLYGATGQLSLSGIAAALEGKEMEPILVVALILAIFGFGFKIAVVPFHLWAPDAYQGAPTPCAAFIASGSKVASFYVLAKIVMIGLGGVAGDAGWGRFEGGWQPVLAVFAALSMVLGNLVALTQSSLKRLLAYSAIAHGGYALVGVMANSGEGLSSVVYYSVTYALATLGAFAVVSVVEEADGSDDLESFVGLKERSPLVAMSLLVFLLSAAGIPPLAGFFGKFFVFTAAVQTGSDNLGLIWLVALGLIMSAVSLYYYLKVLKLAFVLPARSGQAAIRVQPVILCVVVLMALGVIVLGCLPSLLLPDIGLASEGLEAH